MALHGTLNHPKIWQLAGELKIDRCHALGILEALWETTRSYAETGAIGRLSNQYIAHHLGYSACPDQLVSALVSAGLLDAHPLHRLVVHDWHEHSDNSVDARLYRKGKRYATGQIPRGTKLDNKKKAEFFTEHYQETPKDLFTVTPIPAPPAEKRVKEPAQERQAQRATGTDGAAVQVSKKSAEVLEFVAAPYGAIRRLPEPEPVPDPEPVPEPAPEPETSPPNRESRPASTTGAAREVAAAHPESLTLQRLPHEIPREHLEAVQRAIALEAERAGGSAETAATMLLVLVRDIARTVMRWPPHRKRFVPGVVRFFDTQQYRRPLEEWSDGEADRTRAEQQATCSNGCAAAMRQRP